MLYFIFLFLYYGNSQWGWYECRRMLQSTIVDVSPLNFVNQHFAPTSKDETDQNIKGANQEITQYTLTAFSLTQLLIDLRHLYKQNDSNNIEQLNYTATDWGINITLNQSQVSLPIIFDQTNVEMVSSFKLIIFSFYTLLLQIRIDINTKDLYSQKYQFMNTTKVYNTQPSTAKANTTSIFVFGIFEADQIQLPANILPLNQNDYYNYIISYTSDNYFQQNTYTTYSPASKYWGQRSSVAVPYIPFFSNCQGFGQYVYFYQLIEHENCTLYKVSETEAINPFSFGMSPRSDECVGLSLYCIMDEKYNDNPRLSRWFELNTQDTMFQIQANPMAPEQFGDELTDLVSIQTTNSIPSGMMPLEVNLEIQYYQVTPQDKRIITGSVTFTNFYKLSDDQKAGKSQIVYNLIVSFISMTQGQLVNNFALEWPVYFILYSIIGAILTLEVATFFLYHYIANRRRPRPKVKFVAYLKSKFQYDSFAGCLLAFFPGMAVYVLISVIMSGQIWSNDVSLSCNFTPSSDTDSGCAMVLFDLFKNQLKYTDSAFTNLRNARCGISFITVGIYMAYYISGIYIPDNKKENIEYNGNVMNVRLWKRSRILYCLLFITTLILLLTEFSFSNLFQNNAYVFLILLKVMQMMLETILEFFFDNNLISSPIGIILSTYINVATMGNPTFYAFLLSTFVDKGIEMCERAYIIKIQDFVIDQLEEQYEKVFKLLKRLLDEEEENFELEDEKLMETQKVLKTNEDDSDSDIVFSDDGKENLASDDESVVSNKISSNNQENSFTKDEQDEFESKFRTHLLDQHHKQFQQFNEEQGTLQELPADESDQTDLIDYFTNFANDIVTIVFYPFIIVAFWMFYNQSTLLSNYQINESQFIYYFLWAIMLIPFQVLIDIFGYNLVEQYHELDFLTYIRNTRERFRNRTLFWKANEIQNDLKCETCFKSLDQWCYSSQYYFITTLQVSAIQMIIFGSQIIYDNQYNLFEDEALIFIILFWFVISVILHHLFVELGKRLKIWDISSRVTPQDDQVMSSIDDEDKLSNSQQGLGPSLMIPNWNQAIEFREQTERLSEINNNFDEFQNEQFRRLFVASNKQWLQDNIKILLSPKTLKTKRRLILDKFSSIYGPLEKKNEEDPVAGFDNAWNFRQFTKQTQGVEIVRNQPQKFSRKLDKTPATEAIVRYWLYRSRNMKTAIKYIGGLLEKITKPFCEYCGLNWGLGVDTEARIEDIYLKFLKHKGLKSIILTMGKEIDDWQNYFPKKCRFRTTCFICNVFMVEEMQKDKVKLQIETKAVVQKKKNKYTFLKVARLVRIMLWAIEMFPKREKKNKYMIQQQK